MKKIIFIFMILVMISCNNQKDEIELINVTDDYYTFIEKIYDSEGNLITQVYNISDEQVKKVSETIEGVKKILLKSDQNFEVESIPKGIIFRPNSSLYMLYVNEMGKITNVVSIESLSKEVDKYIVDQMKNWKMEIYKINDKPIKYIINWSFELFKPKGENHLSLLNSSLKVSENIKTLPQEEFFVAVEEMPSPIGGMQAIQQKIIYPELARKAGIEGRVYVKAFIDENGNVASAEIIRGLDGGLSEAAMEAVKATKFEPGRQRGVPVKVQVSIPILFKLSNEEIKK